ncbi:component of IIS longevity pathway SMK-1-domain-containing protein [Tuber indicum]|nr:component of IIS longevity pathway SMK-1-domain-containing protein [Tuber indicum]
MALSVPNPPTTPRRVKVYELRNNDWFDRGTGYCTGQLVNDEPHIQVKSEEEQDRMLLETKIIKDDGYQKQQETLIVWTEPHGTDMALSFQEPEGCAAIWEFVSHVQSHLLSVSGADEILSDDANETLIGSVMLPSPELGNLTEIEAMIRSASSTAQARDSLGKFVLSEDFIRKLIPLLGVAEDLESLENLHRLCNIMKMIILLNDTLIIEHIVTDEVIFGVVGILEYDPDFPSHKANHRQFLSDTSKFKEVVPIKDPEIKKKIHWTYRLQYLKDVVLARILDDPTFSVLNSLIFFNQVDILQHLQNNQAFLKELFSIFHSAESDPTQKKNGVLFIQQCCSIAKNLQGPVRTQLYSHFIQNGLFAVIDFALLHDDASVRIAGTDVLVAMIDHDPAMMRAFIFRQISDKQKPLTDTLIELLLGEQDLGVKAQIADAIRILLDPSTGLQIEGLGKASDITSRLHPRNHSADRETENFLKTFYDDSAKKLFLPLSELDNRKSLKGLSIAEVSLFSHLVDTLCFFVRQHAFRGKYFFLAENLPSRVAQLLQSPEKHLKLSALKFFRTCVGLQDEFYIRHMIKWKLFGPILGIVIDTMPRDNLLNSACLEFFEFIKRENIKQIIVHLGENYRDEMKEITYVDTFNMLILRCEQLQDTTMPSSYVQEDKSIRNHVNGARRWQGVKDMDAAEEEYFNTSDEEDNAPAPKDSPIKGANGSGSPVPKPLVDYADDDPMDTADESKPEEERRATTEAKSAPEGASSASPTTSPTTSTSQRPDNDVLSGAPMPERLSEKRRREEEDDDELGKLRNKRRSPTGSGSANALTKKRSSGPGGSPPTKKIAINLAVKTSTGGSDGGGGGGEITGGGGGEPDDEK